MPLIAGTLPNGFHNLIRWIRFPRPRSRAQLYAQSPGQDEDAAHISAYLYTLRSRPTWVEKVACALRRPAATDEREPH
ncbi:MAG: hypothetical protein R2851_02870 [Caldilineaceae bacterium]